MSKKHWTHIDDLVVKILAGHEWVATAMMSGTKQNPLPIRKHDYDVYMKRHNATKTAILDTIKSKIDNLDLGEILSQHCKEVRDVMKIAGSHGMSSDWTAEQLLRANQLATKDIIKAIRELLLEEK